MSSMINLDVNEREIEMYGGIVATWSSSLWPRPTERLKAGLLLPEQLHCMSCWPPRRLPVYVREY